MHPICHKRLLVCMDWFHKNLYIPGSASQFHIFHKTLNANAHATNPHVQTSIRITSATVGTLLWNYLWAMKLDHKTGTPTLELLQLQIFNRSKMFRTRNPHTEPSHSGTKMPWTQHVDNSTQTDFRRMQFHVPNQKEYCCWQSLPKGLTGTGSIIAHAFSIHICKKCFCRDPVFLGFLVSWSRTTDTNRGKMFVQTPHWTRFTSQFELDSRFRKSQPPRMTRPFFANKCKTEPSHPSLWKILQVQPALPDTHSHTLFRQAILRTALLQNSYEVQHSSAGFTINWEIR